MRKNLFKGFILVLAGLFVFITLLSLFIPSKLMITRAVVINAKAGKVYEQVSNLRNWKNWQPVFVKDSSKIKFYIDEAGISNSCQWKSNGKKNKITITTKAHNMVTANQCREGENDVLNSIKILPLADTMQVQTEWNVLIKLEWYPWEKFYGIFIEKLTGQGYEDALKNLKEFVENND